MSGLAIEGRLMPEATTPVLQGTFHVLAGHIRCCQSLNMQQARSMHVHNAGLAPTAGETQAILRVCMGPGRRPCSMEKVVWQKMLSWRQTKGPGQVTSTSFSYHGELEVRKLGSVELSPE